MAKLFRMPLVCLGTHHAPQAAVHVSPARARHWIAKFNEIKAAGNKTPIPWGHQLQAVPYGDAEARRFAMSRWNAGTVERLEFNPDTNWVEAVGTVPPGYEVETDGAGKPTGRLVNPTDHTVVSEMSAGIGNWKDGRGTVHRDIIVHAALCTLPVVAGQPGVVATMATGAILTATLATDGVEYLYTLGTATMTDKKPGKKDDAAPEASELVETGKPDLDLGGDLPAVPEMESPAPVPAAIPTPVPAVSPDAQVATDVMSYAAAVNLPIPADTTPQNLLERLKVALSTVAALGWKLQAPQVNAQQPESQINTSTAGATPETAGPGTAYMSTEAGGTITLSADAAQVVEAYGQEVREAIGRRWTALAKSGRVRPEVAQRERDRLPGFKPAVDPVSKRVSIPEGRERLELVTEVADGRAGVVAALTGKAETTVAVAPPAMLSTATAEPNPARPAPTAPDPGYLKFLADQAGLQMKATV